MHTEGDLRAMVTRSLKHARVLAQPIESGETGLGIPDMFIRTTKTSAWMELKFRRFPIHYPFEVPFRPGQYAWLERNYKMGGTSVLMIGTLTGVYAFKNEQIEKVYDTDLLDHCGWFYQNFGQVFPANEFVMWLDGRVGDDGR